MRTSRNALRSWALVTGALGLCGGAPACIGDLDPKDVVVSPRILDILVDRPEVNPGQAATFRVFLGGTRGPATYRWITCVTTDATRGGMGVSNFGNAATESGCFGDAGPLVPLGTNATAMLRVPPDLLSNLDTLGARFGMRLPTAALQQIARDIGLVVGVGVIVEVDGVRLQGYKRVVVSTNPAPNTNPPPPRIRVGNTWVTVPAGEGDVCLPEDGTPLRIGPGQNITLVPDPNEERWIESYRVLSAAGELQERRETIFYSWYSTGGRIGQQLTRTPTRDNFWTSPSYPGPQTVWVFVRDGHGGTSGCRINIDVM